MSLGSAGARGSLVTVLGQVGYLIVRTASLIVLARLLAPDVFGLVAIVSAIIVMANSFIYLGLPAATAQEPDLSQRARSSLLLVNTAMGLLVGGVMFALAVPIADLYGHAELAPLMKWMALAPVMSGITAQFRQQLIAELKFGRLALAGFVSTVVGMVCAVAAAILGATYGALVAQVLVTAVTELALVVFMARWIPGLPGRWRDEVIPLARIGVHIFGTSTVRNLSRGVITPAMGLVVTPTDVGYYDRAQQLTLIPITLTVDQLQRVVVPVLSRLRDQPMKMLDYMQKFQLVGAYLTSTGFLLAAALAEPLLVTVLGSDWGPAGIYFSLLAIGAVFRSSGLSMQWLFISAQKTAEGFRFTLWSQPVIAALTLAGLPFGAEGVALFSSIAWILYWPLCVWWTARSVGFPTWSLMTSVARGVLLFSVPVAAAALAARSLPLPPPAMLACGLAFALVVSVVVVCCVKPVRRDVSVIWRTLKLAINR